MLTFFMLSFQELSILLGIYILSEKKLGIRLFVFMLLIAQVVGYLLFNVIGIAGIFILLSFFIVCLFLKTKKIIANIFITSMTIVPFVLSGYIAQVAVAYFVKSSGLLKMESYLIIIETIIGSILTVLLCLLIRYIFSRLQVYRLLEGSYGKLMIVFPILTIIIFYTNIFIGQQQGFTLENIRANSILFLFYTCLLFGVFIILIHMASRNIQMENERVQNEQLREYIEELERQYEEIRKFRHDYINILSTMTEYFNQKDFEGLTEYFSEKIVPIGEGFQSNDYQLGMLSNIKVQEVKGIVSNKLIRAQDLNIHTIVDVVEPIKYLHIDTMKLCRSLGIILDNAIEEAQLCEEPALEIAFIEEENLHLIILKNSCRDVPAIHQIYQKGFSTKGSNRGFGLSNLRELLMECDGVTLDTYIEGGHFVQEIGIVY